LDGGYEIWLPDLKAPEDEYQLGIVEDVGGGEKGSDHALDPLNGDLARTIADRTGG
jgi:hypothetical protein